MKHRLLSLMRKAGWIGVCVLLFVIGTAIGAATSHAKKETVTETSVRYRPTTEYATTTVVRRHIVVHTRVVTRPVTTPPPPERGFDYGAFAGDFQASGISVHTDDIGVTHMTGRLAYTGGLDCAPSYVEISVTFFDSAHDVVDTDLANFTSMAEGSWYPFDASTTSSANVASAAAVISQANC